MKKIFSILLVLVLLLGACSSNNSQTTKSEDEQNESVLPSDAPEVSDDSDEDVDETVEPEIELQEITFVLDWVPNTNHTGIYVADQLGYFADEGLSVDIQNPPEDGAEMLVAAGRADIGVSFQDYLAPAFAIDEPLPLVAIAALVNHNTSGIVSLEEKNITSPAELEGHTYATWSLPIEQAILNQVLSDDQGDWGEVELFPSNVTDIQSALQTQVDAVWIYYGWDGVALDEAGLATNFWYFKDINPVFDYYSPVLFANSDYVEEYPDRISAFLRATEKGYQYAIDNPEEAAEILLEAASGLDPDLVIASQQWLTDEYIADAPYWGYIDAERWDGFYSWLAENDLIEKEIPAGMGFTNDYLPGE